MATARRQVKNLCNVGHKGKDDKEADVTGATRPFHFVISSSIVVRTACIV
jgi:hypothetical protein